MMASIDALNSYVLADNLLLAAACILATGILLDFFDISLPRGDSVGVGGALYAASLLIIGPWNTAVIAILAAVFAHLARRGVSSPARLATIVASRIAAITAATAAFMLLPWGTLNALKPSLQLLIVAVVVSAVFLFAEIAFAQATVAAMTSRPFVRLMRGNLRSQAPMLIAQWSASVLLLLTFDVMQSWALIPAAALLLLMRQSYAMFLDIRETYRTTVEVLVEAAESQDSRKMGHADRSAAAARAIAMRIGLSAPIVERISYAALLHDIAELSEETAAGSPRGRHVKSADIVSDVEFFRAVEPILRVCDGDTHLDGSEDDLTAALIVALASDIDAMDYAEVAAAHHSSSLAAVAARVSPAVTARVVGAAIQLGYRIPAVG